ncbi:ribonuclease HII [Candidatus Gracilibacteria bacterium]|nr:ribonuclease HII [Candidatus Gracilibacteria bacterium]
MPKNQYKSLKKPSFGPKDIKSTDVVIGVDEVGRGAWAGPVVAACVLWKGKTPIAGILRDSKKMTAKDREKTYEEILHGAHAGKLFCGIGIISNDIIDSVGIREANRLAMEGALQQIRKDLNNSPNERIFLLIDGRDNYSFDIPNLPAPLYIVRGDSKIKQIMAASILAKVTRDRLLIEYEDIFLGYGFSQHKGYGTELHQKALKKLGITEIHRKSYKPIKLATSGKGL